MNEKSIYKILLVLIIGTVLVASVCEYASIKKMEIEQDAETERTEERSQFWQKLIPWGDDEQEENK